MPRQIISTTPHFSGLGNKAFESFEKVNDNFLELYTGANIPVLPAASALTGAELFPAVQGGTFVKATLPLTDRTVATYAAARLLPGVTTGDRLQVLGRTSQSDGGQGLFTWVAGGTTTVDEGYVLQATGGTWQRVDPSPTTGETLLNAVWFNVKPTNADTVNDTGFAKLKAQMQTSGTTTWRVYFPPGAYTYQNNRWLFNVQKVIIEAYDCTFQCTINNVWEQNCRPLNFRDVFDDSGDIPRPTGENFISGYKVNTATAGTSTVTTTTAADAGNFTVGMRVLIHGYDQQGAASYPFNLRYYESKVVLSSVAGTGVVTFTSPLQFNYDSRWWDTLTAFAGTPTFGAPRIISLERTNYTRAKLLWFKGMSWLANSVNSAFVAITNPADLVICEDVTGISFIPTCSDRVILKRCKGTANAAGGATEIDKILGTVTIEDSVMDGILSNQAAIGGATGCIGLAIRRTTCVNGPQVGARHVLIDDCDVIAKAAGVYGGIGAQTGVPVTSLCVRNTRVYNTGGIAVGVDPGSTSDISFTVGTVSGTNIQQTWNAGAQALAYNIDYGMTLSKSDGTKSGVITGIYYNSASGGLLVITGTWAAPVGGETWRATSQCINQSDGGGNSIIGTQLPFWRSPKQLTYPSDITLPGNPTITGTGLGFSNTPNTLLQNTNGIQAVVNGTNVWYLGANGMNMMGGEEIVLDGATPLRVPESGTATAIAGLVVLVGGSKTISNTMVNNTNYRVVVTSQKDGGTPGWLRVNITDFTSFTITSSSGTDTSSVYWEMVRKG